MKFMLEHWIWLSECKIGLHQKALLLRRYQDAETIYGLDESEYVVLGFNEKERTTLREKDLSAAQRILENCVNQGIRILTYQEARYPNRLRQLEQPPVLLYYKGQIPEFDTLPVIAAIGARKMSAHGYEMAKKLGYQMGRCGLTVISGIAAGIDAASLEGALMADAPVAAVLGCGADIVYPAANRRLYADVELEGCLLTEYPPGSRPEGWHFPVRNRLLAGLSVGVLVVEAGAASGSLITVRHALEQGKDIFAVPSNADSPAAAGSNHLLQEGAFCVSTGWEVAREYVQLYPDRIHPYQPIQMESPRMQVHSKISQSAGPHKTVSFRHRDWEQLTDAERNVFEQLCLVPIQIDTLIEKTGLLAPQVLSALTMFEIQGLVKRLPGGQFRLNRECALLVEEDA